MSQSGAWCLERYRPLLRLQARHLCLNPRLKRLFDSSDLVQDTYERAVARLHQFKGTTEAELVAWLRVILQNIFNDQIDKHEKEIGHLHLANIVEESSARLIELAHANNTPPSQQAEREESLLQLAEAIGNLKQDYQDVIIYHYLEMLPVADIAQNMGRTEKSVAGLLLWARQKLREELSRFRKEP